MNPNIARTKALRILQRPSGWLRRKHSIIKVELLYLPCYLYAAAIDSPKARRKTSTALVDALHGTFAHFTGGDSAESLPEPARIGRELKTPQECLEIAREEVKRAMLFSNLKQRDRAVLQSIVFDRKIYYPFWVGYFQRKKALDFRVADGLSGKIQGVSMRQTFMKFLLQDNRVTNP